MSKPRATTSDELRDKFIDRVLSIARYWANEPGEKKYVCEGTAFSILALLDGSSPGLPAFDVVARPHPDDKDYCKNELKEDWVEDGTELGVLHEFFHRRKQ